MTIGVADCHFAFECFCRMLEELYLPPPPRTEEIDPVDDVVVEVVPPEPRVIVWLPVPEPEPIWEA